MTALSRMREEIAAGLRTPHGLLKRPPVYDDLWRNACRELTERDMEETREIGRRYVAQLQHRTPKAKAKPRKRLGKSDFSLLAWEASAE